MVACVAFLICYIQYNILYSLLCGGGGKGGRRGLAEILSSWVHPSSSSHGGNNFHGGGGGIQPDKQGEKKMGDYRKERTKNVREGEAKVRKVY